MGGGVRGRSLAVALGAWIREVREVFSRARARRRLLLFTACRQPVLGFV